MKLKLILLVTTTTTHGSEANPKENHGEAFCS